MSVKPALSSEFVEAMRPSTILGRLINVRRVPFVIRFPRVTASSTGPLSFASGSGPEAGAGPAPTYTRARRVRAVSASTRAALVGGPPAV